MTKLERKSMTEKAREISMNGKSDRKCLTEKAYIESLVNKAFVRKT